MANIVPDLTKIRLLVFDVDGVLTDGRLGLTAGGDEVKFFSVRDGLAVRLAVESGLRVVFLSGRSSEAVSRRAEELGVSRVMQGSRDKVADLGPVLEEEDLLLAQVAFMGDDLNDLALLEKVGFSAAPADAVAEVRKRVDHVCRFPGGAGAAREMIEMILKKTGKWDEALSRFRSEAG